MSLSDVVKIIKHCWVDVFAQYFNNSSYEEWGLKFDKCAYARNPIAHGHEEYLTDLDKQEIDAYCKQIFEVLKNVPMPVRERKPVPQTTKRVVADFSLLKQKVNMQVNEVLANGDLKGLLEGKHAAVLSKSYLKKIDAKTLVNKSVLVEVYSYNNGVFLVKLLKE